MEMAPPPWESISTDRALEEETPLHDRQRVDLEEAWNYVNEPKVALDGVAMANSLQDQLKPVKSGRSEFFTEKAEESSQPISLAGRQLADLGQMFQDTLQILSWERHCKTLSTVRDGIFPLPLGVYQLCKPEQQGWLGAVLRGLNSLYGCGPAGNGPPSELQKRLVQGLLPFVEQCMSWVETVPQETFSDLFQTKGVDYRGEEVKLARSFEWKQIAGALPDEVGTLRLEEFCTGGCRHFTEDFTRFLVEKEQQSLGRTPRVMVLDEHWEEVAKGLLEKNICGVLPQRLLHHVGGEPLLNGMFAVSKNETQDGVELHRLIMNLVPLNRLCKTVTGDVGTLPTIAGFSSFFLADGEVAVMCSEDIKCFYYLFLVPENWQPFMAFARQLPETLVPSQWRGEKCYLVSRVLPMGWSNSVGLAQHIHRNVVRWSMQSQGLQGGEGELRRDKPGTRAKNMYRVYLDNWDSICRMDKDLAREVEGRPSPQQLALRHQYEYLKLPRHPKKAVAGSLQAEIQGALIDGDQGVATAKPGKILKYVGLAWEILQRGRATQRELQVVSGGLVYITMFRRALLCSLNAMWKHIEELNAEPPVVRRPLPREVKMELARFLCLIPLAQMDFRVPMVQQVTASDASTTGGGISASIGLTSYGVMASKAAVRGETCEPFDYIQVLTVGLFDGIAALRVAADLLELPMAGHITVECNEGANRVVEANFPGSHHVKRIQDVDWAEVQAWACQYPSVGVVLVGAGPPCQDVSRLNVDRAGSQRGLRSSLYKEVPRVVGLCKKAFPWAQVHQLLESVASMDDCDREAMSQDLQLIPFKVDAAGVSLARRPRLYWCTWELLEEPGVLLEEPKGHDWGRVREVRLTAELDEKDFLEPGWGLQPNQRLATFTTSRPSPKPGRRPAGLHHCDEATLQRWREDSHRYPPYQYKPEFGVHNKRGEVRVANVAERELILGFPLHYTQHCMTKQHRVGSLYEDLRKTLLGNSWSVPVVAILMKALFQQLGILEPISVQEVIHRLTPGRGHSLASVLQRAPLRRMEAQDEPDECLAARMAGLVSVKGEDLLLQSSSEVLQKTQRFRQTVPSKAWRWREVTGWAWKGDPEHINQLELRAVHTTIKWLIVKQKLRQVRVLHLVDSMVVLHALSRGRSSSRKLRRTLMRIQALLLTANLHPVWAYVHTAQNPADRPSRRVKVQKWGKVKSG